MLEMADWSFNMADTNIYSGRAKRSEKSESQYDERMVHIDRVARVVKGGRRFRFRALVIVGDHKGSIGVGVSKGQDVTTAITKATDVAKKNIIKVALYKDTIPHEADGRVSGARIMLKPASAGTGLIAGGVVRIILEVAGIKNALSKSLGSSNKINIAYATVEALASIQPASKWISNKSNVTSKNSTIKKVEAV